MRQICYAPLLVLLLSATGRSATKLNETPVQDALRASIALAGGQARSCALFSSDIDDFTASTGPVQENRKSIFRAALYSALVPGGGQYYLGQRRTAKYFFATEALTWIGYFSFRTYGGWKKDDYINFAAVHANARLEGKRDEFLDWVGFYENIREFNTFGRAFDPDRPYLPDTPDNHWEWRCREDRQAYRDLRNRSKEAYRRSEFMIGFAIIDRVVSIIDAVRSTGKINRRLGDDKLSGSRDRMFRLSVNPLSSRRQLSLTVYPGF